MMLTAVFLQRGIKAERELLDAVSVTTFISEFERVS